jgi:hypothetical protein
LKAHDPARIEWRRHYRRLRLERKASRLPYYKLAAVACLTMAIFALAEAMTR